MKQFDINTLLSEPVNDRRIQEVHSRLMRKFEDKIRGLKSVSIYQ